MLMKTGHCVSYPHCAHAYESLAIRFLNYKLLPKRCSKDVNKLSTGHLYVTYLITYNFMPTSNHIDYTGLNIWYSISLVSPTYNALRKMIHINPKIILESAVRTTLIYQVLVYGLIVIISALFFNDAHLIGKSNLL